MADVNIEEWLKEQPPETELKKTDEGYDYIPIGVIENLLDYFDWWNNTDFKYQINKIDRAFVADASILLSVGYMVNNKERILRRNGSVSFVVRGDDTKDFSSIALSLCIANAAKKLGNRFGRSLNGRSELGDIIQISKEALPEPDMVVLQKWKNAIKKKNNDLISELEGMYDFSKHTALI